MKFQPLVEQVTLRPAVSEDGDWATPLLFAAGPEVFSYSFASPAEHAQTILRQAFSYPHHAFSYEYALVAEVQHQPVGVMIRYSGSVKRQADEKVHSVMARLLPLRKLPKILMNVADLSRIKQEVQLSDYYILGLSVLPEFRNQGLGSRFLAQAEVEARSQHCSSLCLDVTYSNRQAKSLFERVGYQVTCSKTTDRFAQMTRTGGLHRMVKSLVTPTQC